MKDIEFIFLVLSLYNTNMGINNSNKNEKQLEVQEEILNRVKSIESKLEKIITNE